MNPFKISEVYTTEGIASSFVYKGMIDGIEWTMYISVGDDGFDEPEEVKNMGKAFGI